MGVDYGNWEADEPEGPTYEDGCGSIATHVDGAISIT
jgi:hypothetical protein